ncbi:MAG: sugar phosphate isomerase/epimerase [Planctomycetota bacterium]|nr:sugar phosphate isomerase/epimerase [Planctomycetota bacterium]
MKVSLFSQSLFALPLAEAINVTADIGYDAIELACAAPHLEYETAAADPEKIARDIRDAGLDVSALSLFNNFTDRAGLREQLRVAETFINLATLFQTEVIKMTPGPPGSSDASEKHWRCLADAVSELVPLARKVEVKLAFETHMKQLTDTFASSERFLDMTPPDCVGLTVDFSNLSFAGEKMPETVSRLKGRIFHTHVKNGFIDAGGGWHFQELDSGITDYSEVLPLLREAGYDGCLSIECLGAETREHPARTARRDFDIINRYLSQR